MRATWLLLAAVVLAPLIGLAQNSRITTVEPLTAKVGDTVTANGEGIDKSKVDQIYLTDGKVDILLTMLEQTATAIKFKVPTTAKPGRWALMIRTRGAEARLLEQPVKLTIE